jgi:hypothetical protein
VKAPTVWKLESHRERFVNPFYEYMTYINLKGFALLFGRIWLFAARVFFAPRHLGFAEDGFI